MKTIALNLALFILSTLIFTGCENEDFRLVPSDQITTENHAISDFEELEISDPFNVNVVFSNTDEALRIEANDNLHAVILVEQYDRKLSIRIKKNTQFDGSKAVLNVFLTTKAIETIQAQGAAQIMLQNQWTGDQATIRLAGASSLQGTVVAGQLSSTLIGASNLDLEGSADFFEVDAEGASNMKDFAFETRELSAHLKGGCEVSVTVHEKLKVNASGASNVYYKGAGRIEDQNLSDTSRIIKMD